jgi:hypothetical protein
VAGQDYRDNATECLRLANQTSNASMKASLLQIAQSWLKLYDQATKNSQADIVYDPTATQRDAICPPKSCE